MNDLTQTLNMLAENNYSGAAFLGAYGLTWLICALLWRKLKPDYAAIATLFQGMAALPIAIGISVGLGMFDARPGEEAITQLSVLVAMSQLLVLPLLIALSIKGNLTAIPLLFAISGAIHFVPYAWIYQAPEYIVMPALLASALAALYAIDKNKPDGQLMSLRGASRVCAVTGGLLLVTCAWFIFIV